MRLQQYWKALMFLIGGIIALLLPVSMSGQVVSVPGTANLWLAGMPAGSRPGNLLASVPDSAPAQSPILVPGSLVPGETLRFGATGLVTGINGGLPALGPDGSFGGSLREGNGISGSTNWVDALVGVFLDSQQPDSTPAPAELNFWPPASLNYEILSPELKQVFFIGDGLTSGGLSQGVVVPSGASRLYLGIFDLNGNYDNGGSFDVTVVPEPAPLILSVFALLAGIIRYSHHRRFRMGRQRSGSAR